MAAALTDAVTKEEWLQAARLSLGLESTDDLRLLEVKGASTAEEGQEFQGFIGETLPVKVRVRVGSDDEEKEAALFLKVVPTGNETRSALAVGTGAFRKESGYYNMIERLPPRLSPKYQLPAPWAPRCFLARETALVFEDLAVQGYKTVGMRSTLDFEHCAATLDALARLHAASIVLEENERQTLRLNDWRLVDRYGDILQEVICTPATNIISVGYFQKGIKSVKAIVSLMPEYKNSPRYQEILDKLDKIKEVSYKAAKASDKYRNVLLHGDVWVNNLMYRYSASGQVEEARLVDFQLTRYGPPSLDVEALLALALSKQLRKERGDELRDFYYAALHGAMLRAGVDPDVLLPRAHFDACRKQGQVFALILCADYMPIDYLPAELSHMVYASSESLEAFLAEEECVLIRDSFSHNEDYNQRVGELVKELIETVLFDENFNIGDFF